MLAVPKESPSSFSVISLQPPKKSCSPASRSPLRFHSRRTKCCGEKQGDSISHGMASPSYILRESLFDGVSKGPRMPSSSSLRIACTDEAHAVDGSVYMRLRGV